LNSGNDGIDFMESTAQLYKMNISSSADKGVSVGENSRVLINDSIISSNNYGVVSKDLSKTIIKNTLLETYEIDSFLDFTKKIFGTRRKKIKNCLKINYDNLYDNISKRAEELSIPEMIKLYRDIRDDGKLV
jgi:hypothetical protein